MQWFRELQQILGDRVRLEESREESLESGPFSKENEQWFPVGSGKYLVADKNRLSAETADLLRLLIQKNDSSQTDNRHWFHDLISGTWNDELLTGAVVAEQQIRFPAVLAVLLLQGEETGAAVDVLNNILSDVEGYQITNGNNGEIWLFLPLAKGMENDWLKSYCLGLLDTLMTELYVEGKMGVSRPANTLKELPRAKNEAVSALAAGTSFRKGQKVFLSGQMGLAHLLQGVSQEAKADFLEEVLPPKMRNALTQELRETVHAYAQSGQNIAETARALYIHRNTLLYRLDKIQEITGRDIRRFEELTVLWLALLLDSAQSAQ
jgi:sugar diacid utilization regulator